MSFIFPYSFLDKTNSIAGRTILSAIVFLSTFLVADAQVQKGKPMSGADNASVRTIKILRSKRLQSQQMADSVVFQSFAGDVILQQGKTLFYADSAVLNPKTNIAEGFGKVFIDDKDNNTKINADYLRYNGNNRKAYLNGNVKLKDPTSTLTTPDLDYDMAAHTGIYTKGGTLVNGTSVLNSRGGIYYGQTHDATFTEKVHLKDPEYIIDTDTLLYNSESKIATFTVPTVIHIGENKKILTTDGYYNLITKSAYFGKRPTLIDSSSTLIADEVAAEDASGYGEARGRVVFKDTVQNMVVVSNHMMTNRNAGTFRATELPVAILQQEKGQDSLYITGDTLYSGRLSTLRWTGDKDQYSLDRYYMPERKVDTSGVVRPKIEVRDSVVRMTLPQNGNKIVVDSMPAAVGGGKVATRSLVSGVITDAMHVKTKDSVLVVDYPIFKPTPSNTVVEKGKSKKDNKKTTAAASKKTGKTPAAKAQPGSDNDRYLEAYNHVRIYSDSMQGIGDSLFYSLEDSTFRLFKNPVVWTSGNQLVGDTIFLFTENKRPKRVYVFENAVAINRVDTVATHNFFNQVRGRSINAMFSNGNIDSIRAKGSAESVYYILDALNKYIGIDKSNSDILDLYFQNKKPVRIKKISSVSGTVTPIQQVADFSEMQIRGFRLYDYRRPKTKYELFEPYKPEQFVIIAPNARKSTADGSGDAPPSKGNNQPPAKGGNQPPPDKR
ncbi:MAG: OstA-like protein [Chitinophagaceae bacterium]